MEILDAKFEYDTAVRIIRNIRNDSSLNDQRRGDLLMRRGEVGYIRHAGYFQQDQIIYQVHFLEQNIIIGCRETELISADEPWAYNEFEYGDRAQLKVTLQMEGEKIAQSGDTVAIISVEREDQENIFYRVQVHDKDILVPARALTRLPDLAHTTQKA